MDADDNEKVKKILKVWFTLCKSYNREAWCQFPNILDDDTFYPNAKVILLTEAQLLGKMIIKTNLTSIIIT